MAWPLRIEFPGAVYHLTSRGNENKPIFLADEDRKGFLNLLADVNTRYHYQQDHAEKEQDAQEIGLTQFPILEGEAPIVRSTLLVA